MDILNSLAFSHHWIAPEKESFFLAWLKIVNYVILMAAVKFFMSYYFDKIFNNTKYP